VPAASIIRVLMMEAVRRNIPEDSQLQDTWLVGESGKNCNLTPYERGLPKFRNKYVVKVEIWGSSVSTVTGL
jgi:hypothetical protein